MKKACDICEHSVIVKYKIKPKYNKIYDKRKTLFCIAAPPSSSNNGIDYSYIYPKDYGRLSRYRHYPVVESSVPCGFYTLTRKKQKIKKYKLKLEEEKKDDIRREIELEEGKKHEKKQRDAMILAMAAQKKERDKIKKEKAQKKKRREYQKKYRAAKRKKQLLKQKKEQELKDDYGRFDILDI